MIGGQVGHGLGLLDLGHDPARTFRLSSSSRSRVMSSARRTNESPTYSTACSAVQSRSARSLSVRACTLSEALGTLIPWCDRIRPGSVTFSRAQPGPRSTTSMATVPSANSTVCPISRSSGSVLYVQVSRWGSSSPLPLGGQAELGAEVALDGIAGDVPQADLGPAQVLQHGDLARHLVADRPDGLERGRVLLVRPVREVEPEDVHPGLDQLPDHGRLPRGRPERRHDLRTHPSQRLELGIGHGSQRENLDLSRPRSSR